MKKIWLLILCVLSGSLLTSSCKKDKEPNKIIDGLPINTTMSVIPGQSAQQLILLKRDTLGILVPVINKLALRNQTYPELTGPDGQSRYSFQISEKHFGTATVTIQFLNSAGSVIDPIQTQTSTTALKTVNLAVNGTSDSFNYNENLVLTLATAGNTSSNKSLTGTSVFSNPQYGITYTIASPGAGAVLEGLIDGTATAIGSGPNNLPLSQTLHFSSSKNADGTIVWDSQEGGIHIEITGKGFIVTNQYRIILD